MEESAEPSPAPANEPPKSNVRCRNIALYGYCRFASSGCRFNHDPIVSTVPVRSTLPTLRAPNAPQVETEQTGTPVILEDSLVNAPEFIPGGPAPPIEEPYAPHSEDDFDAVIPEDYASTSNAASALNGSAEGANDWYKQSGLQDEESYAAAHGIGSSGRAGEEHQDSEDPYYGAAMDSSFYYPSHLNIAVTPAQPLQYHLYAPPLPYITGSNPQQRAMQTFFMADDLREELLKRVEATVRHPDPYSAAPLPDEVHVYHSLLSLDDPSTKSSGMFGFGTWTYRVTSSQDGNQYLMRRVEGFKLTNELAITTVEPWRRLRHANLVSLREAFTTKAFGDNSIVFIYDYHPLSATLASLHFTTRTARPPEIVQERVLWSYISQITSALKAVHSSGLACRAMEPSKILITGRNRIRFSSCGILDLLSYDGGKNVQQFQQEDLINFGQLVVALACGTLAAIHSLAQSIDFIFRSSSADLRRLIQYLLSKPSPTKSIDDVIAIIGPRLLNEINGAHHYNDFLESDLTKELENARLVRLMMKLGFINERPEFAMDPKWSETGDRYLLKLFRDYVFHQVDENGKPVVDMAHVISCLNKLDVGVDEKVMLMSRDDAACLIVSYRELKAALGEAFAQLTES